MGPRSNFASKGCALSNHEEDAMYIHAWNLNEVEMDETGIVGGVG